MKSSAAKAALKPHRIVCDRQKTSRKSATLHTLTLGALVGLLLAPASQAQTLPEVVISATRAQQQSFDAPAAIQAVGREAIEDGGAQINLSESLKRVPGLTILNRQNYAQDLQLSIRGFGARSTFGIRGIRLLIDGIPATTPDGQAQGSSIALTSTERIEVLRGPLAQLYGNAAGGVIQAFSREAPEHAEWNAQVFGGSFGLNRSDWQFAGKLGQVGLLADYSTLRVDGYRQNSQTERKQFNGKLAFDLSPSTRVHVSLNLFDMPLAQDPIGLDKDQWRADPTQAGTGTSGRTASDFRVRKSVQQNQIGSALTQRLGEDQSVTLRAYYGNRDNLQFQAGSGAANSANFNGSWVGLGRQYSGAGLQYNARIAAGAMPINIAAGYEFDRSNELRQGGSAGGLAPLGEIATLTRNERNKAQNSDLFGQATALLTERLSGVLGYRASSVRFSSDDYYLSDNRNGSGERAFHAGSPVAGLTIHASPDLNLYANYGKGFETPTLSEVAYRIVGTAPVAEFNPALNASISQHREIGAKWTPVAGTRVDLNGYQIDSENEIVVSTSSGGQSAFQNAPGTRRRGIELSGNALLSPNLRASLASNWIDAHFARDFSYSVNNVANQVREGFKIPGIPQYFNFAELLWSSQTLPVPGAAPGRLSTGTKVALEMVRAGRLYANDINSEAAQAYAVVNLMASQSWHVAAKSHLAAYARIDNLSDKHFVGSVIVNQSAAKYYEPAPGRNWILGLRLTVPL